MREREKERKEDSEKMRARERERKREKEKMGDREKGEETEKKCLYASKLLFSVFTAFHASTVSVNYRFEGTEDDVETKAITWLPNKTTNHLGYSDANYYELLLFLLLKRRKNQ